MAPVWDKTFRGVLLTEPVYDEKNLDHSGVAGPTPRKPKIPPGQANLRMEAFS